MTKQLKALAEQIKTGTTHLAERDITVRPYSTRELDSIRRMLETIYANQTNDEQTSHATVHHNGEGFTGNDAEILTDIFQRTQRYGLSQKQAKLVARKLTKYSRQLAQAKLAQQTEETNPAPPAGSTGDAQPPAPPTAPAQQPQPQPRPEWWQLVGAVVHGVGCGCLTCKAKRAKAAIAIDESPLSLWARYDQGACTGCGSISHASDACPFGSEVR